MTASLIAGQRTWSASRTEEGQRNYVITHLVETNTPLDGPANVMQTPGLPAIGSFWNFDSDIDIWAFCTPDIKVTTHQHKEGDPVKIWKVENKFTTRPFERCRDTTIQDPLLEPQKISGTFVKYTKEAVQDKDGGWLQSSSHEQLRGPQVEIDANRPTVHIEQNVIDLELNIFSEMVDKVNSVPMWGLGIRRVKLSNVSWERKHYGTCNFFYTRAFDFDVNFLSFDRDVVDEGTKVLNGAWTNADPPVWDTSLGTISSPSVTNPSHFDIYEDPNGNAGRVLLDGSGEPITSVGGITAITIQFYQETDFFILGIPTTL